MNETGKQKVFIFTHQFEITGDLNMFQGVRLTDYMNESKAFISVLDAEIRRRGGEMIMKAKFMNVRKDEIEIIVPEDMIVSTRP